jgi:hypothetical protein
MNKIYILFFLIIAVLTFAVSSSLSSADKEQDSILTSAESLFKMMKEKNYVRIWFFLSHASRNAIIDDTYKNTMHYAKERGKGIAFSKEQIKDNFTTGGILAQAYWNSYLDAFNPDMVLEQSRWEMGKVGKDRAQINIIYRKAERPAVIQMYKEEGVWKVGLIETFKSAKR